MLWWLLIACPSPEPAPEAPVAEPRDTGEVPAPPLEAPGDVAAPTADPGDAHAVLQPLDVRAVAPLGDVDGDGHADVAVGVDTVDEAGAVLILHGPLDGDLEPADAAAVWTGDRLGGRAGSALAGGDDLDGDGSGDVVALRTGPWTGAERSRAFLVSAAAVGPHGLGSAPSVEAGGSVAIGDVNGDGHADLVAGFPWTADEPTGGAVVYLGPIRSDRAVADADALADRAHPSAPSTLEAVFDADGDGRDDLLMHVPGSEAASASFVAVVPVDDARPTVDGAARITGVGEAWEVSVAAAGDVDGDGHEDVVIGLPALGRAVVVTGPVVADRAVDEAARAVTNDGFDVGWTVAGAGDVNRDGFDDLLVGGAGDEVLSDGMAWLALGGPIDAAHGIGSRDAIGLGRGLPYQRFGWMLAGAGDVSGDGAPDVLVGAYGAASDAADVGGGLFLYLGESL